MWKHVKYEFQKKAALEIARAAFATTALNQSLFAQHQMELFGNKHHRRPAANIKY